MARQPKRPPDTSYNLLNPNHFNLSALLRSGQFYLDDSGLLVAPNGTRYRIPSGPPEGRKPLRPDRPEDLVVKPKPSTFPDGIQQPFSLEQQDSDRLSLTHIEQPFQPKIITNATPAKTFINKPDKLGLYSHTETTTLMSPVAITVDWDVVLLTLILCSISLACNLGLVLLLSRKICHIRRQSSKIGVSVDPDGKTFDSGFAQRNSLVSFDLQQKVNRESKTQAGNLCTYAANEYCKDPIRKPVQTYFIDPRLESDRLRHRQRIRRRHKRYTNRRSRLPANSVSHIRGRPNPVELAMNRLSGNLYDRTEQGSSSGSSWKVVVSDGMISETTGDEGETTEDSGNNSDALVHLRRSYWKRGYRTMGPNTVYPTRSCRTEAKLDLQRQIESDQLPTPSLNYRLDTIRSTGNFSPNSEDSTSTLSNSKMQHKMYSHLCANTIYVSHTLGIHYALLGVLLSLVQLITVCSALSRRMTHSTDQLGSYLSEVTCVLATSLAADTVLCARQYLIAAILAVFWTTFALSLLNRLQQPNGMKIFISSLCTSSSLNKTTYTDGNISTKGDQYGTTIQSQQQQRYAYLALVHSLPWAVAAGTALVITFALFTNNKTNGQSTSNTEMFLKLNIFFRGLESLLVCHVNHEQQSIQFDSESTTTTLVRQTTNYVSREQELVESWVPLFLLILLPILVHILICLIYSVVLRVAARRRTGSKESLPLPSMVNGSACGSLCAVFLLIFTEFVSCAIPVICSIIFAHPLARGRGSSIYVNRLILLHLLIDPWLIACMMRSFNGRLVVCTNSTEGTNPPKHSLSQYSDVGGGLSFGTDNTRPITLGSNTNPEDHQKNLLSTEVRKVSDGFGNSPLRLMDCLPIMNQNLQLQSSDKGVCKLTPPQPVLMSCLPNASLLVSAVPRMEARPAGDDATNAEYFLPIHTSSIPYSTDMSQLRVPSSSLPPQTFETHLSICQPSLDTSAQNFTISNVCTQRQNLQEIFPQLCQHHQQLLDQHYKSRPQQPVTTVCHLNKNFGNVPRMMQTSMQFLDSFKMNPISKTAEADNLAPECVTNHSQQLSPADNSTTTDDSLQHQFSTIHRQYSGKSTATAAVMAAAAAAVAAQAGTISRNITASNNSTSMTLETTDTQLNSKPIDLGVPATPLDGEVKCNGDPSSSPLSA
ncbi:hypothetical protein CRM22_007053 [Opisthorchis felineus]|uniref:Uncharacterized protein n=1 Tax=Opisthorchis felineus TaxID=147828 RepID=A0A4S2LHW7_OPIFE|nr:hypothetical protein CRM22_007053 [Opisthorchis felineus]